MKLHPGIERRIDSGRANGRAAAARARRLSLPLDDARAVFGTARSGTTWLMELIANDRRSLPIFEPLHPFRTPAGALRSIEGYHVLARQDSHPELEDFLRGVLTGRRTNAWSLRDARLGQVAGADHVVAKMIRLCAGVGWFNHHFPQVRTVGVVRHPAAMVSSMRRAEGRWRSMPEGFLQRYAVAVLGREPGDLVGAADPDDAVARFAVVWAADNYAMVRDTTPEGTHLVGFEELVTDAGASLARVGSHLGLDLDVDRLDLGRSSMTRGPQQATPATDLGRWKHELTTAEIDTILHVAHEAGLTSVSADPALDMDAHRRLQATLD